MKNVDIAIYLVHSIIPSAKLTQASFKDTNELPPCLRSRLECKDILGAYGVPVTTLRARLIISAKGSYYPILKNWYPMLVFI